MKFFTALRRPHPRTILPLLAVLLLGGIGSFALDIQPFPREVLRTEKLHEWTFASGVAGFMAQHECALSATGSVLRIQSRGKDPYLASGSVNLAGPFMVQLRMKSATGGKGQFFWTTTTEPHTDEARSQHFNLIHDGQWHDYSVRLDARGTVTRLRLDPGSAPGLVEVEKMALVHEHLHPLELQSVHTVGRQISLTLTNHAETALACRVEDRALTLPAHTAQQVTFTAAGKAPFAAHTVQVLAGNLPPLRRTVFVADAGATGDWVMLRSPEATVRVARDGSGARLEIGGQLVGFVAPLVWRNGKLPQLKLVSEAGDLHFAGDGINLTLAQRGAELAVAIQGDGACEGPVLRALGALEQGLFAGVEYLGKNERSSSTLDIETEEHIRYAPDPLKVTMPLMAFSTDRALTALTWTNMTLQPIFATPDFLDGAEGHRAALRGRHIAATLLVRKPAPLEDAILWAVQQRGLPPVPPAPRSREAQMALSLKALMGPPLRTAEGWGHCAEAHWPRHPFADCASTIWRLTGEAPQLPHLAANGGHIRNESLYFVTGRAQQWLQERTAEVRGIIAGQKPDGSFHYTGKYQRGHFEDTASGYCAMHAIRLLDFARATGDRAALATGLKALDYMKRFRTPRGAQIWECALHTPDILASAHLVHAYVRGFELTGDRAYLDGARRWAITGVPFVYQWSCQPVMLYATTPVLGATNWRAPNWIGLPVQWCGYDYAYALAMLAPHDKTLDWHKLAEGILITAEQMQYPDGEFAGCVPDSFSLAEQQRNPWNINPCAIVSLRLVLEGQLDSLAVAAADGHRVVAPYPVTVRAGKAHIAAKAGVSYQVLIDGARIVPVTSRGNDELDLNAAP